MSASVDRHRQPRSHRGARRVAAALLALPLAGTSVGAVAPATAHTVESAAAHIPTAARGACLPVGRLTYSSGAGTKTWGLRAHAAWSSRVVKHRYAVGTVLGYRPGDTGDHGNRLAADFMVYSKTTKGHRVARFAKKHRKQLNITYIIWNQRIWSVARASEGWRKMPDQGSPTANHKNHVHISFRETPNNFTYRD